ncbi:MAG TPA: DNA polymerase III subunit gamma/tau [Ignavibacteriaceae bacterium]|nr:DNA polymerase III subunit gamma/tau [Ignavibacteriaceae bacterium]
MEYQVTARKWRPQKFDEVVGQEHITSTLKNALKSGRIAHAFLFTGPRGVGKTTTARILAKSLNCENSKDFEPCNECSMCKSISTSQTMDIIEIDGASNRGIDEIRTLRESVKYAPTQGKYKVYIIDEVHMLTKESFNAFLKTLEEPPAHTIFIFATTDIHKVPLTIISRCQRFDFRRIQLDVIKAQLSMIAKEEGIDIDDKTLTTISKKADGALRDAESYFDQVVAFCGNKIDFEIVSRMLNLIDEELYFNLSDAILNKNFKSVFETTDILYKNGWDFIDFLDGLSEHFRNILSVIITNKTSLIESADVFRKRYAEYIDTFSKGDLIRLLNYVNKTQQEIRYSQNQRLKIEIALTHLIGMERTKTISEIINDIDSGSVGKSNNYKVSEPQKKTSLSLEIPTESSDLPADIKVIKNDTKKTSSTVNKLVMPVTVPENFEDVVATWQSLVESIQQERALLLGGLINSLQLIDFDGQNLTLSTSSEEVQTDLNLHRDYIDKKIYQIFGKKLGIILGEIKSPKNEDKLKKTKKRKEIDPIEKLIADKLGGEEIG